MLHVVGGLYRETCREPRVIDDLYGSGGRGAAVAVALGVKSALHCAVDRITSPLLGEFSERHGVLIESAVPVEAVPQFEYRHTLSVPTIRPMPLEVSSSRSVVADTVLRFGMLELHSSCTAETAVYDPQSAFAVEPFRAGGSSARRLAVVVNKSEAEKLAGRPAPPEELVRLVQAAERADVVVLKAGAEGAWVADSSGIQQIPCYRAERVWSLGSGDTFAAAFAVHWGLGGARPTDAADAASRVVAAYVEHGRPISSTDVAARNAVPVRRGGAGRRQVYLAAPLFTMGERWLLDEVRSCFPVGPVRLFSPLHEVGRGPPDVIAEADLRGLEESDAVLAVLDGLDPGTLVEVGHAAARGLPVVALAERVPEGDLLMLHAGRHSVAGDLPTAVYHAIWAAMEAADRPTR